MRYRTSFERYIKGRQGWDAFEPDSWRICSPGSPSEGQYADQLLQQLWECWKAASTPLTRARPRRTLRNRV